MTRQTDPGAVSVQVAGELVALITERYREGVRYLIPHLLPPQQAREIAAALLDAAQKADVVGETSAWKKPIQ